MRMAQFNTPRALLWWPRQLLLPLLQPLTAMRQRWWRLLSDATCGARNVQFAAMEEERDELIELGSSETAFASWQSHGQSRSALLQSYRMSNQTQACLVSTAAVALSVNTGHCKQPRTRQSMGQMMHLGSSAETLPDTQTLAALCSW